MAQIIDCVFVSTENFIEPGRRDMSAEECYQFCIDANIYATHLRAIGFCDDELPRPLIHVFRATELVIRTEPCDDILDFLEDVKWSPPSIQETISSLEEIGANLHARFLAAVHLYLRSIRYEPKHSNLDEIHRTTENLVREILSDDVLANLYTSFEPDDRKWRSICFHCVKYMEGRSDIRRVPGGAHNREELRKYFLSKPDLIERLKEIRKDDPAGLKRLLDRNVDAELLFASRNGYLEQVKALISANIDVNANAANGIPPLIVASQMGHSEVVRALLAANADVNAKWDGRTALMVAGSSPFVGQLSERLKVMRALLAAGADVNARDDHGSTALIAASFHPQPEVVEVLIAAGADVNAKLANGVTALWVASPRGYLKVVNALLDANADVNAETVNGETPLIAASERGHLEVVHALLDAKADVDAALSDGRTALFAASYAGHLEVVKALVAAGSNINANRADGATALTIASQNEHQEVAQFLSEGLSRS
jgi:ankyrin repeat protein